MEYKTENNTWRNKTKICIYRQQSGSYQRESGCGVVKRAKFMVMRNDFTLGGGHIMQQDHVS